MTTPHDAPTALTVGELIKQVFPNGTRPTANRKVPDLSEPPFTPPDLFAVTALLLQRSAAYHRICADEKALAAPSGSLTVTAATIKKIRKIGRAWALTVKTPSEVTKLWTLLLSHQQRKIFDGGNGFVKPPAWWKPAYQLMAIADEACEDVGYFPPLGSVSSTRWVVKLATQYLRGSAPPNPKSRHLRHSAHRPSITSAAVNQDIVCVQPKARTPDVGCSVRNMSHNLSLLPPRGVMRVHWLSPPSAQEKEESASLNLLLVPFPYELDPAWFDVQTTLPAKNGSSWGWFELRQKWLIGGAQPIIELVKALLEEAGAAEQVHGIVFPEYALNYQIYEDLAKVLRDEHPSVQFLVAGSSSNCAGADGNFALASHFFEDANGDPSSNVRMMASVSRPKHHRWSLETGQIKTYGLEAAFPGHSTQKTRWWEKIPLHPREVHINGMRSASVFTVMICEDLARSDPAHEPVRAVGPNLVFVLLMDGPQLEWRWAARYSTALADDPGSSVLALTSRALVARWNSLKPPAEQSWSVGLWKDEESRAIEINCAPDSEAILLRLRGRREVETTMDGRDNSQTFAWHILKKPMPISLDRSRHLALLQKFGR